MAGSGGKGDFPIISLWTNGVFREVIYGDKDKAFEIAASDFFFVITTVEEVVNMWAANIIEKEFTPEGKLRLRVVFTEGVNTQSKDLYFTTVNTIEHIRSSIEAAANSFGALEPLSKSIVLGPYNFTPPVIVPEPPDPRKVWQANFFKLEVMKKLVDLTVLSAVSATYTTQLSLVTSTFQPGYLD